MSGSLWYMGRESEKLTYFFLLVDLYFTPISLVLQLQTYHCVNIGPFKKTGVILLALDKSVITYNTLGPCRNL